MGLNAQVAGLLFDPRWLMYNHCHYSIMSTNLPTGTVTFLFTDIEGSTKLAQEHPDLWETLRERHHAILQTAIDAQNGYVFQIIGDAFCVAFHTAKDGLNAALDAQRRLQTEAWGKRPIRVRMGLHTGATEYHESGYRGYLTMARVQRVMSTAYGGQILLSNTSAELIRGEIPEGVTLRDMKENRLKGLLNPEHLWQVVVADLPQDFPPLATLNSIPNNLPIQVTSFVGREKEITEVKQLLSTTHLLTLIGSGGTGKTRLSLHVAAEVLDTFKNGVWFIELAPLSDPALMSFSIASVLGVREEPGRPLMTTLMDWLSTKELLLILDNCEHLIEACAKFADEVMHASRATRILATSREALGISGESIYRVPSLQTPNPEEKIKVEQFEHYAAVRLFIDRATQSLSTFRVTNANAPAVAQICYRLDGIPLAIELAAARVKALSVEKIAERLDDRFRLLTGGSRTALPRQQTLRSMIDWSHSLLSEPERILYQRLSVFAGGWTIEAAEDVCSNHGLEPVDILDLMTHLVDKSLVVMDEGVEGLRFHMLETIRQYAVEKLEISGEAQVFQRLHAGYFSDLTEPAEDQNLKPDLAQWLNRLERERNNLREALRWAEVHDQEGTFLRLAGNLWRFWASRGPLVEGRTWLDEAATVCEVAAGSLEYGLTVNVLGGASELARMQGDFEAAFRWKQKVLEISRQSGDERWVAAILHDLAVMYAELENCERSLALAEEAVALRRKLGRPLGVMHALDALCAALMCRDEPQAAREAIEEAAQIARDQQVQDLTPILTTLILIAVRQGRYEEVQRIFEELLPVARDMADHEAIAAGIYGMGTLAAAQGQPRQAARLLGCAQQIATLSGFQIQFPGRAWFEHTILGAKARIGEAVWAQEYQAGQALATGGALTIEHAMAFAFEKSDE
jgi:predicted ATPase/class 3 adenylate cyclase